MLPARAGITRQAPAPFYSSEYTLKKLVSKAQIRSDLEREVSRFLSHGGEIENVPTGVSGKDAGEVPLLHNRRLFLEPKESRTLVPEVVAAIEQRRQDRLKRTPARKRSRLPKLREKVIYDDFGEPLRRVVVDE